MVAPIPNNLISCFGPQMVLLKTSQRNHIYGGATLANETNPGEAMEANPSKTIPNKSNNPGSRC